MGSKWEMVRLGDVATYINGYAFKPSDWSETGLPIIRIQNLTGNDYETNYFNGEYKIKYEINDGDVLISWSASLGVYHWNQGKALVNQHIFKVVFDKIEVDKRYFIYTVKRLLSNISAQTHGSTMKHITKPRFDNILFPLPPLEEQKNIAAELDKITTLIAKRKTQLEKLDLLVKAKFVEMFGDPVENPMGWEVSSIEKLCCSIVDCPHSTPKYTSDNTGYMCIKTSVVRQNNILWDKVEYISEEEYCKRTCRKIPQKNDIIYSREGAILGIAAIINIETPVALGQRLMLLSVDKRLCTPYFLCIAMNFESFLQKALEKVGGSASPHINVSDIKSFKMIVPPISLQTQYTRYIKKTEETKTKMQAGLAQLELLYKERMQDYFG